MGRNKAPSENTIRMLCSKAAGMCEFEGCNKRLFYDGVTLSEFNNAYVAHIIASSANGPRGDKVLSPQLSDKLENLMLMCSDHHKLIDIPKTGPRDYPVDRLKEMKRIHEEKVDKICQLFHVPETEIIRFSSPIKGKVHVDIDYKLAAKAVLPNKQPASNYGIFIDINSFFDYKSEEYWKDCLNQLKIKFNSAIFDPYIQLHKSHFSVFPIAPMPLIIKLGELFGDKLPCDVFQKTREPDTWEWQADELTNKFSVDCKEYDVGSDNVAIALSLTNEIVDDRIFQSGDYKVIYKIKALNLGVDCLKSIADLSEFWHLFQSVCEDILNKSGKGAKVHLFPAMPNSAAFEIGRRYMPDVYPLVTIYEESDGFFPTLTLGG